MHNRYYKTKDCFIHRKIADTDLLISVGENIANFNGCVILNPTASFLWDALSEPKSAEMLIDLLLNEFDVTEDVASKDVEQFLQLLEGNSMVIIDEDS